MSFQAVIRVVAIALTCIVSRVAGMGAGTDTAGTSWIVTTGAGLSVTVNRASCDITSILFNSQQLQSKLKYSHLNSGLGTVTSSIKTFTDGKLSVQITCTQTGLAHYMVFRDMENTIYMGTYNTAESNMPNLRFIARLDRATIQSGPTPADISGGVTAVEGSDVFKQNSTGQTRSKFYSAVPFFRDYIHSAWGTAGTAYMVMDKLAYETSVGGPFFRDHDNQITDTTSELYWVPYSSHSQTEVLRYGFHGPYALAFTTGAAPTTDFSFFQNRLMQGFYTTAQRGNIIGKVRDPNGLLNGTELVHFYNDVAQYWTMTSSHNIVSPMMIPGTYTVVVYRNELNVGSMTATVTAGTTLTIKLDATLALNTPIWRVGEWDGTSDGLLNGDKIHWMHPSDPRMSAWSKSFNVATQTASQFPMALFRGANSPLTITFSLTSTQASAVRTLRVGVTLAEMSGRPIITVNGKWTSAVPVSYAIDSRGVTRGVTSGNYFVYEYAIPVSALLTGTNSVVMSIASGVTDMAGYPFLSACVVFDALELI